MKDKLTRRIGEWLSDSADDCETSEEHTREEMVERMFRWMLRNLVPQLAVAFGLLLAIIFLSPIEVSASWWFRAKEPLCVIAGYIIVAAVGKCQAN